MRGINASLIDGYIKSFEVGGLIQFCLKTTCSLTLASQLRRGTYRGGRAPGPFFRKKIAKVIGQSEDILFPVKE